MERSRAMLSAWRSFMVFVRVLDVLCYAISCCLDINLYQEKLDKGVWKDGEQQYAFHREEPGAENTRR